MFNVIFNCWLLASEVGSRKTEDGSFETHNSKLLTNPQHVTHNLFKITFNNFDKTRKYYTFGKN